MLYTVDIQPCCDKLLPPTTRKTITLTVLGPDGFAAGEKKTTALLLTMSRGEGGGEEGMEQDDGLVKVPDEDAIDLGRKTRADFVQ